MADTSPAKDEKGRFITGNIGGGRPKGARAKLGEAFLSALQEDFENHGADAITKAREAKPEVYIRVIASLLPTEHKLTITDQFSEMTDDELIERIRQLHQTIAPLLVDGAGDTGKAVGGTKGKAQPPIVH
jgi:hypothetical protein